MVEAEYKARMTRSKSIECLNNLANWREDPEEIKEYKRKLDAQMEMIVSQLILFEGNLKKEQVEIRHTLTEKDRIILLQKETILKLDAKNEQLRHEYTKMREIFKRFSIRSGKCEAGCSCDCHQMSEELSNNYPTHKVSQDSISESYDVFDDSLKTDTDDEAVEVHKNGIQECTISLTSSPMPRRPRRVVESGSIRELAKHHRERRASGGTSFMLENVSSTSVTRSNSLPDSKLLNVVQTRSKSLPESTDVPSIVSSSPVKYTSQETMPLLHSQAVLNQMVHSGYNPGISPRKFEEKNACDNGSSGAVTSDTQNVGEEDNYDSDNTSDSGPPQFYDIDGENVLNEDFRTRNGKFKHVKSPPNQSPNKNPRRPKSSRKDTN